MREQNRLPAFPITGLPANSGTLKPSGVPNCDGLLDSGTLKPSDVPDCVGEAVSFGTPKLFSVSDFV